jgi:hypothetical protein
MPDPFHDLDYLEERARTHSLGIDTSWGRSFTDWFVGRALPLLDVWIEGKNVSSCFLQNKPFKSV